MANQITKDIKLHRGETASVLVIPPPNRHFNLRLCPSLSGTSGIIILDFHSTIFTVLINWIDFLTLSLCQCFEIYYINY